MIIIVLVLVLLIALIIWTWFHPESFMIPISSFLQTTDSGFRTNFYTEQQCIQIFPASQELEKVWMHIRNEGRTLFNSLAQTNINYLDAYNLNLGKEDKSKWTTLPLRLFNRNRPEYMEQCPITSELINSHPDIVSCIFSIMEPGKIIHPHVGPYDGLLRYQLALDIPILNDNEDCYLHVGGEKYHWTEGKGILFDETRLHGAVNNTTQRRMVLLIDIKRPYEYALHRLINTIIVNGFGLISTIKI